MQVKKFEAKSMPEALALVKKQLGPDAIILSAKDRSGSFGLMGETSIEVTAAVSESTLKKKQWAEKKMREQDKNKFENFSAKSQKNFINKTFEKNQKNMNVRPLTQKRYIDIGEENLTSANEGQQQAIRNSAEQSEVRIRSAAQEALKAAGAVSDQKESSSEEVSALKSEIAHLKGLLKKFQSVPQNFVTMHPGANEGIPYELSFMFEKMVRAGISPENTVEILSKAKENLTAHQKKNKPHVDAWVVRYFLDNLKTVEEPFANRYHVFIGPPGHGKTSSLVKMASYLVMNLKKKVAIVTTDSFKVGASEQLRTFAQILNIPFAQVKRPKDWAHIESKLFSVDHILVDFPGFNLRNQSESQNLQALVPDGKGGRSIHYVQSVLAKDSDAFEIANKYMDFGFGDVIFTGLDESVQHGLIYNFQKNFRVPLHSFGIGPNIPEDMELATKERVVDLFFKLTKVKKERG